MEERAGVAAAIMLCMNTHGRDAYKLKMMQQRDEKIWVPRGIAKWLY